MEGVAGGAEEGGAVVEDDAEGDASHEFLEAAFGEEGFEEYRLLQEREDFGGDAAADEDAAGGHGLQGEVAGFGAEDGSEDLRGLRAERARAFERAAGDDGAGILLGDGGGNGGCFGGAAGGGEKAVNIREAHGAAEDAFDTDVSVGGAEVIEKGGLYFVERGEIAVSAFACEGNMFASVPKDAGFTEAGAGGDDRHIARCVGGAGVEHGKIGGVQLADAVGVGHKVVDEEGSAEAEFRGERGGVDFPREIDELGAGAGDGSGQAEAGEVDSLVGAGEKRGDEFVEGGDRGAGKFFGALESERCGGVGAGGAENAEPSFGAADVAAENECAASGGHGPHGMRIVGAARGFIRGGGHVGSRRVFPLASVALEEAVGGGGAPRACGVVGEIARRQRAPDIENGVHDTPGGVDAVFAMEEGHVPDHAIVKQRFVSGSGRLVAEFGVIEVERDSVDDDAGSGAFGADHDGDAFLGLDVEDERVGSGLAVDLFAEEHERGAFEADKNLREVFGEAFAGAQVEGDIGPTPVFNEEAEGGVGFSVGMRVDAGFVAVGGDGASADDAGAVLSAHAILEHFLRFHRADGVEDFDFLVAHGVAADRAGRFHGDEREDAEHVVLHHVAQHAVVVEVGSPVLHAEGLGHGNLDAVDVAAVPVRLEDHVGEAEDHDVLHGFFAEVVVDAVDL